MKKLIALVALAILLVDCSTVPITGRQRLNLANDDDVYPMSFAQYEGFLKENKLSTNAKMTAEIKTIGKNISAAVDRFLRANRMAAEADKYKWEFNLVDNKTVNAWCLPGGKVVFYTGIMPICKNEDGIAAVMGHEVAHAFAKHGQERMTSSQLQQIGGAVVAVGTQQSKNRQLWNLAYGIGSNLGMLSFSRTHETEADKLGLIFMIMAGYNGEEAAEVWVRMSQRAGSNSAPPKFLSTHPPNADRIRTLRNYYPTAKRLAEKFNKQAAMLLKK